MGQPVELTPAEAERLFTTEQTRVADKRKTTAMAIGIWGGIAFFLIVCLISLWSSESRISANASQPWDGKVTVTRPNGESVRVTKDQAESLAVYYGLQGERLTYSK